MELYVMKIVRTWVLLWSSTEICAGSHAGSQEKKWVVS